MPQPAARFVKRPVVIEAMPFDGTWESGVEILKWTGEAAEYDVANPEPSELVIVTLEGRMTVSPGDWVIQGVNGEFYPCKPDIFEKTYDPLPDPKIIVPDNFRAFQVEEA